MSYTPHEWQNDELITAAKLNNLEEGVAAGGGGGIDAFVIHFADSQLDKTWQEIFEALELEKLAIIFSPGVNDIELGFVLHISLVDGTYSINTTMGLFIAATASDYPVLD